MNRHMKKLLTMKGAVTNRSGVHDKVVRSPSPYFNSIFGNGWGLPYGYSMVIGGPEKGGKSIICNTIIGQLHYDDPEAVVMKFDTERREEAQVSEQQLAAYGIDPERYIVFGTNDPYVIFNRLDKEVKEMLQDEKDPLKLKLLIIDSVSQIKGRRGMNTEDVMAQQIGDKAATLKQGFESLLDLQRDFGFAVILTTHIAAEMDQAEQMRGNKFKLAIAHAVKHYAEYQVWSAPIESKAGRQDAMGNDLVDEANTDALENADRTGHRIRVQMKKSSFGIAGRSGEFTLDYKRGIINTHEEVFGLGYGRGLITLEGRSYSYKDRKYVGKPAFLAALKEDTKFAAEIVNDLRMRDLKGEYDEADRKAEKEVKELL